MARIADLQMPLRPIGHEIPKDTLLRLGKWDLVARCAAAQSLRDQAEHEPPGVAEVTRGQARRVLLGKDEPVSRAPVTAPSSPSVVSRKRPWASLRGWRHG